MSTASTRCPDSLKATARLSAVVVLATPPFWLAKAITFAGPLLLRAEGDLALAACLRGFEPLAAFFPLLPGFGPTTSSGLRRPLSLACAARFLRDGDI